MEKGARDGTHAHPAVTLVNLVKLTRQVLILMQEQDGIKVKGEHSVNFKSSQSAFEGDFKWTTEDFIKAHKMVVNSGEYNYEGCKIPIPTAIRYDRLEEALGESKSPKDESLEIAQVWHAN